MHVDVVLFAHLSTFQPDGQGGRKAVHVPEGRTRSVEELGRR